MISILKFATGGKFAIKFYIEYIKWNQKNPPVRSTFYVLGVKFYSQLLSFYNFCKIGRIYQT